MCKTLFFKKMNVIMNKADRVPDLILDGNLKLLLMIKFLLPCLYPHESSNVGIWPPVFHSKYKFC